MDATRCVIAVDIGTSSTKAVVFDRAGALLARHGVEYPLSTPVPGAAEQDPDRLLAAVIDAIAAAVRTAGARTIDCVSFSAAMHSLIALGADGRPLTPCITWADTRAAAFAERIRAEGGDAIYRRTGTPIHPMSPLPKLAWLKATMPATFAAATRFCGIKEYVFLKFFGRYLVDHSIASATGLFDVTTLRWDAGALAVAGVAEAQLPEPVPTTFVIDGLAPDIAARTGLDPATPFVIGANDGVLANLGVGAITPGAVAVTIGTSGAIRTAVTSPRTDARGRLFCYVLAPGLWIVGGPTNNGGMILRWLRDEFGDAEKEAAQRLGVDAYDLLTQLAERAGAGAGGLLFHPYLAGERAPLWNADARGSFFGLAMHHRKEHMVRAVLEGVVFNLHAVLQIMEETGIRAERILASGGFARSRLWRQIMADIFGREVMVGQSPEASCLGAAILGMVAIGTLPSLDAATGMACLSERSVPDPANAERYRRLADLFARLPDLLHDAYRDIAAYQREMPAP